MPDIPSPEERLNRLLELMAKTVRPCHKRKATLYFLEHKNGNLAPYTIDGLNHFINCPNTKDFRRAARA